MLFRLVAYSQKHRDMEHVVYSLGSAGKIGAQMTSIGVEVQAFRMRSVLDVPRVFLQLYLSIRRANFDIVQTWMYHADLLGGLAARLARQKLIFWGIRRTELLSSESFITSAIRRLCARLSKVIPTRIICAATAARRAHAAIGYDDSKMLVVVNGFDVSRTPPTLDRRLEFRAQLGFAADTIVIGSLGSYKAAKDHANFISAAAILARDHLNVRFLLVGRGIDAGNLELGRLLDASGVRDRFILLSERADVWNCYAAMDVFCLHSRTEGFPNVVAEAMAMSVPCVVTDVGDAAFLLGSTGMTAPPNNPTALANGLAQLVNLTADQRAALGVAARARITAHFTIENAVEGFERIYREQLNSGAIACAA